MQWIEGGVTAAEGFRASGVSCGIKRSGKPDLALVVADASAAAAGVWTTNRVQAAPVRISAQRLRRGLARGVLLNSGCANCLTGEPGTRDALAIGRAVSQALGIAEHELLVASTGLIGRRLPVPRMVRAVPKLVQRLSRAHHREAARAILTTDRMPKEVAGEAVIDGMRCHLGGMAKGAGMIAPSMATMLCVITTDAAMSSTLLRMLLVQATEQTFNRISIDGDMSTNDTVFALASGRSGLTIRPGTPQARMFAALLLAICSRLATLLVEDGEGASRTMEVRVEQAQTPRQAQQCARQVANSPLVKTMLAGSDPNIGRIAAAVGASGAVFDLNRLEIFVGGQCVVKRGTAVRLGTGRLRALLTQPHVEVEVRLHAGPADGRMLSCDLTEAYVRINAGYAT